MENEKGFDDRRGGGGFKNRINRINHINHISLISLIRFMGYN